MRYFTNDKLELLTEDDIKKAYEIADFDGNLKEFTERCLADGSIKEIPTEEAREVAVENMYTDYVFAIKATIPNGKEINWNNVNLIIIDDEESKITSASGYSFERGEFTDLY